MKVLVTGVAGLVGGGLARAKPAGVQLCGTYRDTEPPPGVDAERVDVAEPGAVDRAIATRRPDVVVHCAHKLADGERNIVAATAHVAQACAAHDVALVHMSTDLVFDGEHAPYAEDARPAPIFDHGRWKWQAEQAVQGALPDAAVVRTSIVVSPEPVDPVSRWAVETVRRGEPVTFFDDEYRTPILLEDLAAALWAVIALPRKRRAGVWHAAGPERLSRADLGAHLASWFGLDRALIRRASAASLGTPRPRDVSMTCARLLGELAVRPRPIGTVRPHGPEA